MSELALPRYVAQGAAEPLSLWTILRSVWSAVSPSSTSERARKVFEHMWPVIESVGEDLTSAVDQDDLDARIDASIELPERYQLSAKLITDLDLVTFMNELSREPRRADWPVDLLGGAAVAKLRHMERTLDVLVPICAELFFSPEVQKMAREDAASDTQLAFLGDPSIHPDIKEVLLDLIRAERCYSAILYIMISKHAPAPWLRLSLAEGAADGFYQYLRLWASLSSPKVPFEVVPAADRFDLTALNLSAAISDIWMREFASGDGPAFPFADDDDS